MAHDAARAHAGARRRAARCSICWLQPWQGGTLVLVLLRGRGADLAARARAARRRCCSRCPPRRCCPALYYAVLERTDAAWELAGRVNAAGTQATWSWPWWAVVLTLAPLALPAALAYRLPARSWQERAVRVWPLAALAVYLAPVGTFPYHAFQGATIPLAVLAVQGVTTRLAAAAPRRRDRVPPRDGRPRHDPPLRGRASTPSAPPATLLRLRRRAAGARRARVRPAPRRRARACLRRPHDPVPHRAARSTSARCRGRRSGCGACARRTRLFEGSTGAGGGAQELARRSGARFVFVDCRPGLRDLRRCSARSIARARSFGCATLYELRDEAPVAAVRRARRCVVFGARDVRDPAQRRGADAAGRRADRRRPGALPRLLVVLPAGPAAAARGRCGRRSARRCWRGRSCARSRPARSRCWRGGSRAAAARRTGPPRLAWLATRARAGVSERPAPLPDHARAVPRRAAVPGAARARRGADRRGRVLAARVRRLPRAGRAARLRRARSTARAPPLHYAGAAIAVAGALFAPFVVHGRSRRRVRAPGPLPAARLRRLPVAAVPARLRRAAEHVARRAASCRTRPRACCCSTCRSRWCWRSAGGAGRGSADVPARRVVARRGRRLLARDAALPARARRRVPHGAARRDGRRARGLGGAALWRRPGRAPARVAAGAAASRSPARVRGRRGRRPRLAGRCAAAASRSRCRSRTACACPQAQARVLEAAVRGDPGPRPAGRADLRRDAAQRPA